MNRLSEAYATATAATGRCAIESGAIGHSVDNECGHGRLSGDGTPPCGCWPRESAKAARLAAADRLFRPARPAPILRALDRDRPARRRKRTAPKVPVGAGTRAVAATVAAERGAVALAERQEDDGLRGVKVGALTVEDVAGMPAAECMDAILAALDQFDAEEG